MKTPEVLSFANPDELARAAAAAWLDEIAAANRAGKSHSVALSGGRITQKFFNATVEQSRARGISLSNVHFFWADERCVPPDHPDSNFKMAKELLFGPLKIVDDNIHRLRGEDAPTAAVQGAIAEISRIVPLDANRQPALDLILLGMGEDGHVASLFPNADAKIWDNIAPFLVIENSPKPPPTRISLGFSTIAAARQVWALVSGTGKETAYHESLQADGRTPLGRVIRARPVKIFSDLA